MQPSLEPRTATNSTGTTTTAGKTIVRPGVGSGDITDQLLDQAVWSELDIDRHGIERSEVPFVSVGGGLGSLAMVDALRISGVPVEQIAVLGNIESPAATYRRLATNSQIPEHERLRSDSGSVMDCLWGWPGYGLREAWSERSFRRLWQVATEPILSEYFTPRASQVYQSVEREVTRIGWQRMLRPGVVRTIRRCDRGGYWVLFTPDGESTTQRVAVHCQFVHIAVGYPGVRFLPDLQAYRDTHDDFHRVVNAYETHAHVYEEMRRRPTTVLVRGAGIVASRVLQRIFDDVEYHGAQTSVVQLFRNYADGWQGDRRTNRRPAKDGWAYQAFNYPKAAWGGQLRDQLLRLEGDERSKFIDRTGGTNTAPRRDWRQQLTEAKAAGTYRQVIGEVTSVEPSSDRQSVTTRVGTEGGHELIVDAGFIIDATGLEASIEEHRVLHDLLVHAGAKKNPKGRLDVDQDFLVRGTESGDGRLYASGAITLGGYYAGVDSFLGLQYAALEIQASLAQQSFGHRLGPRRSLSQWWRWARNLEP